MRERVHILFRRLSPLSAFGVLSLAALATSGCVSEHPVSCPPPPSVHRFELHCGFDARGGASPVECIGSLVFYVFDDTTGLLAAIVGVAPTDIARGVVDIAGLGEGSYTFVAWGTGTPEGMGHFTGAHLLDPATGTCTAVEVGVTRMEEFFVVLNHARLPGDAAGDVAPLVDDFDDLYFALARGVEITRGGGPMTLEVVRNTSMLDITARGLEHLDALRATRADTPPLDIFVVGRNGRYGCDNTTDDDAPVVRYASLSHTLTEGTMRTGIKTLRLDKSRHTGREAVLLHLRRTGTGEDIIPPIDVLAAIGSIHNGEGIPLYPTQREIDREDRFDIQVDIYPPSGGVGITVRVSINGWEVVVLTPETEISGQWLVVSG